MLHTDEVLTKARGGDRDAFGVLVEPYRRELHVHCYRMLGSVQDAEDVLQETLFAAWRGLERFEGRSSVRSWLYRIATNRCLNALRDGGRRPDTRPATPLPEPTRIGEPLWLQPYPDALFEDTEPGPEARYESREAISLAFVSALQRLPARQRATLVLRDVLGLPAEEAAQMLGTTRAAINSALKRARAGLEARLPAGDPPPLPGSARERRAVAAFVEAFERGDVDGMVALLTGDVLLTMPPRPLEYEGHGAVARFFRDYVFGADRRFTLELTRSNGQPAFTYATGGDLTTPHGTIVLTLAGDRISAITRFRPLEQREEREEREGREKRRELRPRGVPAG
ncbi:RNA polymerase subunit sigma-70 [Actinomadura barringtoniae]|uniref:RNA polymerase subunit sigma-70 n=1 Tax=Actinomadura barringtoniae TaxID=1427535 RepID=A0A939PC90_9ACTN|nr:RNA polymerase subunit sigma-70 [Actinomadura barringtoniae]MBO2447408.1 RNA polymerase subunit sigma-70 [Actinomadura barringtoniae]